MDLIDQTPNPFGLSLSKPSLSGLFRYAMSFWAYMLHCADRSFYVGHTDDLDARLSAHQSASIPGYTSTRLPVTLVWSSEFPTRYEAIQAERQIKGWSRAKKLALIRGDWKPDQRARPEFGGKGKGFDRLSPNGGWGLRGANTSFPCAPGVCARNGWFEADLSNMTFSSARGRTAICARSASAGNISSRAMPRS